MHKLTINNLGPIKQTEICIDNYIVLTGAQASGKSTTAKAIYYFRTIKDDIQVLIMRKTSMYSFDNRTNKSLYTIVTAFLREKFMSVFGSSWSMDISMSMKYFYADKTYIRISLTEDNYNKPNYIKVELSKNIIDYLKTQDNLNSRYVEETVSEYRVVSLKQELRELFFDEYEIVYIPAGRSMITLLASQLNYFFISLEDSQKRMMDYCTRNYIENIIKLRPEFERGLMGLNDSYIVNRKLSKTIMIAQNLISKILNGTYNISNGEEKLFFNDYKYVKINFASSGQQEILWILNLLYYALIRNEKTYFIIEEPESHLFPDAQKQVVDFIGLVANNNNGVLVTTHSPYVLGATNNQLFAFKFTTKNLEKANEIIDKEFWINPKSFNCYFVKGGALTSCIDEELRIIDNSIIDEISYLINKQFDMLSDLEISVERKGS